MVLYYQQVVDEQSRAFCLHATAVQTCMAELFASHGELSQACRNQGPNLHVFSFWTQKPTECVQSILGAAFNFCPTLHKPRDFDFSDTNITPAMHPVCRMFTEGVWEILLCLKWGTNNRKSKMGESAAFLIQLNLFPAITQPWLMMWSNPAHVQLWL